MIKIVLHHPDLILKKDGTINLIQMMNKFNLYDIQRITNELQLMKKIRIMYEYFKMFYIKCVFPSGQIIYVSRKTKKKKFKKRNLKKF